MLAVGEDILAGVDTLLGTEAGFGTPAKVREERRRHDDGGRGLSLYLFHMGIVGGGELDKTREGEKRRGGWRWS